MQTGRGKPWQGRSKPGVLALAAAVLGLLLSVAHTAGLLWPKRPPTFASALDSRPLGSGRLHAGWHARADMHCIPNGVEWTACLIKDLYYDTREREFLFFGRQFGEASVSAVDTDLQALFAEQMCASRSPVPAHAQPNGLLPFEFDPFPPCPKRFAVRPHYLRHA